MINPHKSISNISSNAFSSSLSRNKLHSRHDTLSQKKLQSNIVLINEIWHLKKVLAAVSHRSLHQHAWPSSKGARKEREIFFIYFGISHENGEAQELLSSINQIPTKSLAKEHRT